MKRAKKCNECDGTENLVLCTYIANTPIYTCKKCRPNTRAASPRNQAVIARMSAKWGRR